MCRTQCLLAFVALSVGVAHSWGNTNNEETNLKIVDTVKKLKTLEKNEMSTCETQYLEKISSMTDIALTTGDQLEFFTKENKTQSEGVQFRDLTALAYDAVHNMLLFVDKESDNASIFSFNILSKKYQSLVQKKAYENIQGLAFDPVQGLLFWTDTNEKSIYRISLKPGSKNNFTGNLLIKMDDEIPRAVAVDSCRGYIYWTNINASKPTIERARFNGSEREVVIDSNINMPVSLAVDQQTKKIYWADDREGIHYSIESADLNGKNRITLFSGIHHQPNALTVSKDSIYWVDWGYKSVWKLPKNPGVGQEPISIIKFKSETPFGIVANYSIQDQTEGSHECEALTSLPQNKSAINYSFSVPTDAGLFCVHGIKVNGKLLCNCTPGYTGERCDTSVCQNYCFQGDCSVSDMGQPKCRCNAGYSGKRCDVNACHGYCLNNGLCSLNEKSEAVCQCIGDYEGSRCEAAKIFTTTTEASTSISPSSTTSKAPAKLEINENCQCNDTQPISRSPMPISDNFNSDTVMVGCVEGWDPVRDPIIIILGILCGMLCLACAVLITKVLQLKRRPRIKKRIIVNKNVTPMTARPDQCEITIENCCNMNICETPCFEPRSTIRPSLLDSKPGKEEKKNLIANMEYPDDSY